jgi:hypothetical protein
MLLGQQLPANLHARLRLPIIFFFDSRVGEASSLPIKMDSKPSRQSENSPRCVR